MSVVRPVAAERFGASLRHLFPISSRMDQIVPLQYQPDPAKLAPFVHDVLHRRGQPGAQVREVSVAGGGDEGCGGRGGGGPGGGGRGGGYRGLGTGTGFLASGE
ncbi:hypothetical protein SHIRM173S_00093 [Streptomyces hirsutus]